MLNKTVIAGLLVLASTMAMAQTPPAGQQGGERAHTDRTVRFKQIDKNSDGKLSLQEFQYRPSNQTPEPPIDAKALADRAARFKQADKNVDGFLTFEEFVALESMPMPGAQGERKGN